MKAILSGMAFGFIVPKAGIEPAHLTVHDFESCASTSSATQACGTKRGANMFKVCVLANLRLYKFI